MEQLKEQTSQSVSSVFAAPSEHMVEHGESEARLTPPLSQQTRSFYEMATDPARVYDIPDDKVKRYSRDELLSLRHDGDDNIACEVQKKLEKFQKFGFVRKWNAGVWSEEYVPTYSLRTPQGEHAVTLPKKRELFACYPYTLKGCYKIWQRYCKKSPFFQSTYDSYVQEMGLDWLTDVFNRYLTPQYKKGTINYYCDLYFDTRKHRDNLLTYLEIEREKTLALPKAEAGVTQEDQVIKEENVVFSDQRETIQDDGFITSQQHSNLNSLSMPEDQWHVQNIMRKPIPFWNGEWTTSQTAGEEIKRWTVPGEVLVGPHYNIASTFTFFRGHPQIRFQLNGTKFHSGRLLVVFHPMPITPWDKFEKVLFDPSMLISMPHVILDAGIANSGVLNLPFVHMNSYFNTVTKRQWQMLGVLRVLVFNKLRSATSSSQKIGLTAWISFDNCELHQPCFAHDVALPKAEAGVEGLVKAALPLVKDLMTPGLTTTVGDVAGGAANCDKPTDPVEIQRWVPNAITGLSTGEGLDRGTRLCLTPGAYTVGDAEIIGTTQDDMDLKELLKIPTRLLVQPWSSDNGSQTNLIHMAVTPTLITDWKTTTTTQPPVDTCTTTLLAYCSYFFKYWRGSLRYRIQVVASQMHTGRLMITYGAGVDARQQSKFFEASSYLNTLVMDLQEKHELEFTVPFLCERPWLRGDVLWKYNATDPNTDNFNTLGYMDIFVMNRLSRPDSVSSEVDINVYVSAGDDFELAVPSDLVAFRGIGEVIQPKKTEEVQAEAGQETVTTRTDDSSTPLVKGSGIVAPGAQRTMGENAMNLKTLLRRYTKVFSIGDMTCSSYPIELRFNNTPTLSTESRCYKGHLEPRNPPGMSYRTALAHFSQLFTFWRGSLRYKLVFGTAAHEGTIQDRFLISIFHLPGSAGRGSQGFGVLTPEKSNEDVTIMYGSMETLGTMVAQTGVQASLEFEVPFYTPYTQLRTQTADPPTAREMTGTVIITVRPSRVQTDTATQTYMRMELYQAAGDDFQLNYLRAAPKIQFTQNAAFNRYIGDNHQFIYTTIPPTCSKGPAGAPALESQGDDEGDARAEMFSAVRDAINLPSRISNTLAKVDQVAGDVHAIIGSATASGEGSETGDDEEADEPDGNPIQLALTVLAETLKGIPGVVGPTKDLTSWTISVANLVSGFNSYIQATGVFVKTAAIVTIVSELFGSAINFCKKRLFALTEKIVRIINGSKQDNQLPKAEAFCLDFVPALVSSIGVGAAALGFKQLPSDEDSAKLVRGVNDKLRLFNGGALALTNLKRLWTELKLVVEYVIDWLLGLFAPQILAQMKLNRGFEEVEQWATKIDEAWKDDYVDRSNWDLEYRNEILRLGDVAKRMNDLLIAGKIGREASIIRDYAKRAYEMVQKVQDSETSLPSRIDPYCICLYGKPGVGKSTAAMDILSSVMNDLGYPQTNRVCSVNPCETFFTENYKNQHAVYIDDFSAFNKSEQYQAFFNLKANTAFPLNMAFAKGRHFTSHFIMTTTNTAYPEHNDVLHKDALWRRRDALIEMRWIEGRPKERTDDYRNSEFRWLESDKSNGKTSAWVNFRNIKEEIAQHARLYLTQQVKTVRHLLTTQGYIPPPGLAEIERQLVPAIGGVEVGEAAAPRTEAGKTPRSDVKLAMTLVEQDDILSLYIDDHIFGNLEWHPSALLPQGGEYALSDAGISNQHAVEQWQQLKEFCPDVQQRLYACSEVTKPSLIRRVKGSFADLKSWLMEQWRTARDRFPWLSILETWPVKLAATLAVVGTAIWGGSKLVHACLCRSIRYMGYRCGLCGRWPKLETCRDKEWMLEEWKSMYGPTQDYIDGHVTSLEEERAAAEVAGRLVPIKRTIGTEAKRAESGPYSQDVKGATRTKVFAQSSAYSQDVKGAAKMKVFAESGQKLEDLVNNRVVPYTYRVQTKVNGTPIGMNAFAIGGRKVLMMKHFIDVCKESFEIFHSGAWMEVKLAGSSFTEIPNKDLVVFEMPIQFHQHRDLTKHFISEKELPKVATTEGYIAQSTVNGMFYRALKITAIRDMKYYSDTNGVKRYYTTQNMWKYPLGAAPGACGSVVVSSSNQLEGQMLGLHAAGSGTFGYATLITREMLEPFVSTKLGTPLPPIAEASSLILDGHFGFVGKMEKGVFQTKKTEIIPTDIQGMITEPVTFPSVLSPRDTRLREPTNVMRKALEKYGDAPVPIDKTWLNLIKESWLEDIRCWDFQRPPQVLTEHEAVVGIPGLDGFERLPLSTSPGYPYVLSRPRTEKGKAYLFNDVGEIANDELKLKLASRIGLATRGERCVSIWSACLKDERRPLEKILAGSTRLFVIPPVDLSIMTRMYTLDFAAACKNNRARTFAKVGIDPQSLEWTDLYHYLASFSEYIVAGDYERFDGGLHPQLAELFYETIDETYKTYGKGWTEADSNVRKVLADESVHTLMIVGSEVIVTHTGNKSGDPLTTFKNCFVNDGYIKLAWLGLARKHDPSKATMAAFRKNVRVADYGDDNLIAIKEEVIEWFNQETIAEFLRTYGIVYTNESKTGVTKYKKLDECTFLKNGFGDHETIAGIKVPLMSKITINELLNWTRIAPDQDELLEDNCNNALRFAYFHGFSYFTELRNKILAALVRADKKLDIMTYNDFHFWFLYVIGRLPHMVKAEHFFEEVAASGNGRLARLCGATLQTLPYKMLSMTGLLKTEGSIQRTDDRYAIAIPSGEGKSWLCKNYPGLFVDHDELLLPAARRLLKENGVSRTALQKMFELEFPADDRRVLLVHHPDNTKRQILGKFVLPEPNYIRANAMMRLRLKEAERLPRDQRNEEILRRVRRVEPQLFSAPRFNSLL